MSESIWNDPRITAYVLDELSSEDRAAFEDELASNPEMEAAIDEARLVTGKLSGLYAAESTPPLDADRRKQILSTEPPPVTPGWNGAGTGRQRSWRLPAAVFAAAAALLLLVGLAPWMKEHASSPTLSQLPEQQEIMQQLSEAEISARDAMASYEANLRALDVAAGTLNQAGNQRTGTNNQDAEVDVKAYPTPMTWSASTANRSDSNTTGQAVGRQQKSVEAVGGLKTNSQQLSRDKKSSQQQAMATGGGERGSGQRDEAESFRRSLSELEALNSKVSESRGKIYEAQKNMPDDAFGTSTLSLDDGAFPVAGTPIGDLNPIGNRAAPNSRLALGTTPALAKARSTREAILSGSGEDGQRVSGRGRRRAKADDGMEMMMGGVAEDMEMEMMMGGGADFGLPVDEGRGAGIAGDRFEPITDNPFKRVYEHAVSTFSVDVDTASYSKVRDFLMRSGQLPRPDAVRIEEMINYFNYDYQPPAADDEHPFAARVSVTSCPWKEEHRLARIALKGKTMDKDTRPPCNLVFLLDTSGSMKAANKLPLVVQGMKMLLGELTGRDKVAIVVYAGSAGLVLDSTSADDKKTIRDALTRLSSGGSTNGGAGIALAYQTARSNFITDGVNRVILCTDGDFNVGTTGTDSLVRMVEKEAKGDVFLSVLGFGMGNHNDAMLEKISGRGNGNYAFIDSENEARKVLVNQTSGTLVTIAKDVKLQVEFNPAEVSAYRLIGYENRILAKEDFNDDKKDAGEIGAGHAVTALYEIVPADVEADAIRPEVDELVYQSVAKLTKAARSGQLMMLKLRYQQPDGDTSTLVKIPVVDDGGDFESADDDVRFAAAVAGFGMQLRRSQYAGTWTMSDALKVARASRGEDRYELRAEFIEIVRRASEIMGEE